MDKKKVEPMRLSAVEGGEEYVLEFDRDAVRFAEKLGFNVSEATDKPGSNLPILFYAAFRHNHPEVSRGQAEKILYDDLEGLNAEEIGRLIELYVQAVDALRLTEGERKNGRLTVKL